MNGGEGWISSHTAWAPLEAEYYIVAVSNFSNRPTKFLCRIARHQSNVDTKYLTNAYKSLPAKQTWQE